MPLVDSHTTGSYGVPPPLTSNNPCIFFGFSGINTISNATTIAAMMQIKKLFSLLSTGMPNPDEKTDAVRILQRLFGCWCWQWVNAVNVEMVV